MCCLISDKKLSKWLEHDFKCFSDVKDVAQEAFCILLGTSRHLSEPTNVLTSSFKFLE